MTSHLQGNLNSVFGRRGFCLAQNPNCCGVSTVRMWWWLECDPNFSAPHIQNDGSVTVSARYISSIAHHSYTNTHTNNNLPPTHQFMRVDEWVVTVQNVSVVCNDARERWDFLRMIVQAQQVVVDDDDVPTHWTTNYAFPLINNHISSIGCIQNHDDRKCMYYMREFVFGGWSDDDVDVYQVDGCGWWMPDDEQNEGNFLKLCQSNDCGKFIIFGLYSLMGIWADIIVVGMGRGW